MKLIIQTDRQIDRQTDRQTDRQREEPTNPPLSNEFFHEVNNSNKFKQSMLRTMWFSKPTQNFIVARILLFHKLLIKVVIHHWFTILLSKGPSFLYIGLRFQTIGKDPVLMLHLHILWFTKQIFFKKVSWNLTRRSFFNV